MTVSLRTFLTSLLLLASHQAQAVYGVQEAINDALGDNLKYVGKFIPHGSESGKRPICVYRGKKVLIYASYCVEYPVGAVNIRIHSADPTKGAMEIYAEAQDKDNINKVKRNRYSDYGFHIATYDTGSFNFNWSVAKLKAYDTKLALAPAPACLSSRTAVKHCDATHQAYAESWGEPASEFWNKPTANWYQLIHLMHTKVP